MFATPAYAQAATAAGSSTGGTVFFIGQFVLIGLIFYFLIIRPQQKRAKEQRAMLEAIKKGDVVVTGGGLVGRVTRVEDGEIEVELAPNVRVRALKGTITDVRSATGAKPAND